MGQIKVKKDNAWKVVASNEAATIPVDNSSIQINESATSVEDVLVKHQTDIEKLKRNVNWLTLHGGGGSGSGSGTSSGGTTATLSDASVDISVNNILNTESNRSIVVNNDNIVITFDNFKPSDSRNWTVVVTLGSKVIKNTTINTTNSEIILYPSDYSDKITATNTSLYITAKYSIPEQLFERTSTWRGTLINAAINLKATDKEINNKDDENKNFTVDYSVGSPGTYEVSYKVTNKNEVIYSNTIDSELSLTGNVTVDLKNVDFSNTGVYEISFEFKNKENDTIKNTIQKNIIIVSDDITIVPDLSVVSVDTDNPINIPENGVIRLSWAAYLNNVTSFVYNYQIDGKNVFNEDKVGTFGKSIVDSINVSNNLYLNLGDAKNIVLNVSTGDKTETIRFCVKIVEAQSTFVEHRSIVKNNKLIDFRAFDFSSGEQNITSTLKDVTYASKKSTIGAQIKLFNNSNITGIKTYNTDMYYRISNGAFGVIENCTIDDTTVSLSNLITTDFAVNICFKCDYHPDDDRVIMNWGAVNSNNDTTTGIVINAHKIIVGGGIISYDLQDNTVYDVTLTGTNMNVISKYDNGVAQYVDVIILRLYVNGVLSGIASINKSDFSFGNTISFGGKYINYNKDNTDIIYQADFNLYSFSIYNTTITDLDVLTMEINNKILQSYTNGELDFVNTINDESSKNGAFVNSDNELESELFNSLTDNYEINFLFDNEELSIPSGSSAEKFMNAIGIPVMVIDASSGWTFNQYTKSYSSKNTLDSITNGIVHYYDPNGTAGVIKMDNVAISLQGTSTLQDTVKNVDITFNPTDVFIPISRWLPEQKYTLKADVVDSSHSNNASIGKFINDVLNDYIPVDDIARENIDNSYYVQNQQFDDDNKNSTSVKIKHTVEGFPVLLIIKFNTPSAEDISIAPVGIFSLNLGRDSVRNLGFERIDKITKDGSEIQVTNYPYYSNNCTIETTESNATWIEIRDNKSAVGFAELVEDLNGDGTLTKTNEYSVVENVLDSSGNLQYDDNGNIITKETVKTVEEPIFNSSLSPFWQTNTNVLEQVFEVRYPKEKFMSDYGNSRSVFGQFIDFITKLPIENNRKSNPLGIDEPSDLVVKYLKYNYENQNFKPTTDVIQTSNDSNDFESYENLFSPESAYKYFVICNLFGLIDNLGKNSTYRSWNNGPYYLGFYDLDSGLGQDNQANIGFGASFWIKFIKNNLEAGKNYGYCGEVNKLTEKDTICSERFSDYTNKLWLSIDTKTFRYAVGANRFGTSAYSYYWQDLRNFLKAKVDSFNSSNTEIQYNSFIDYFYNEYFLKQTGSCGSLLFNLDYRCKYLTQYTGTFDYSKMSNISKLHGRKEAYTYTWLKDRILFLDSLFNWRNSNLKLDAKNNLGNDVILQTSGTKESFPIICNTDLILRSNVNDNPKSFYACKKNQKVYINTGSLTNGSMQWHIATNSSEVIQLGDEENKLSEMNISTITKTEFNQALDITGLNSITELDLSNSTKIGDFDILNIFSTQYKDSELRVINLNNVQSSNTNKLNLSVLNQSGITRFGKLEEIDIENSNCVASINIPNVPLKKLNIKGSSLSSLNLDAQNYLTFVDVTGCASLQSYKINNCNKINKVVIDNLSSLTEVTITNNLNLESISITNCKNLTKINIERNVKLNTIIINNCANLTGSDSSFQIRENEVLETLDLHSNSNLSNVIIYNSNKAGIKTLNLATTNIVTITGDGESEELLDLSKFTNANIIICNNNSVKEIQYANNKNNPIVINYAFSQCKNLERVYGNIKINVANCFYECSKFSIHGTDATTWNGKSIGSAPNILTPWQIISGSNDNAYNNGRPFDKITDWFVSGTKVTNLIINRNKINNICEATSCTEFDFYYLMFIIANYDKDTSFGLNSNFYRVYLFDYTKFTSGINRFAFYGLDKCTNVWRLFSAKTPVFIQSYTDSYNNDNDNKRNGTFSSFINVTRISEIATSGSIIIDQDTFVMSNDTHVSKITNLSWFTIKDIVPSTTDKTVNANLTYSGYNSIKTNNYDTLGDFTGFFKNLPNLKTIIGVSGSNRIDYSTLKLPKGITEIRNSLNATNGVFATDDNKLTFVDLFETNTDNYPLTNITYSMGASGPTIYMDDSFFAKFPNLIHFGRNRADAIQSDKNNFTNFTFYNWKKKAIDGKFPYNILKPVTNIENVNYLFANLDEVTETVKFPSQMFKNTPNVIGIEGIMKNVTFTFTLTSRGFENCTDLRYVAQAFYHNILSISDVDKCSKLTGFIPTKLFYHGGTSSTKDVYGANVNTLPTAEDDVTIESTTINTFTVNNNIEDIRQCFYGCLNLESFKGDDTDDKTEINNNYSPYEYNYDVNSNRWYKNDDKYQKIAYYAYNGHPDTERIADAKYLDDIVYPSSTSIPSGKDATYTDDLHYMCAPDLLRYCKNNADIRGLFRYCGILQNHSTSDSSGYKAVEYVKQYGIEGRIVPYLLLDVNNITDISHLFEGCRRLATYNTSSDGSGTNYLIPQTFFNYATNIITLHSTFASMTFKPNTNLQVFNVLNSNSSRKLDIAGILSNAMFYKNGDSQQEVKELFRGKYISEMTGAFSRYRIAFNETNDTFTRGHISIGYSASNSDSGNVKFENNFTNNDANKAVANLSYDIYYGWTDITEPCVNLTINNNKV